MSDTNQQEESIEDQNLLSFASMQNYPQEGSASQEESLLIETGEEGGDLAAGDRLVHIEEGVDEQQREYFEKKENLLEDASQEKKNENNTEIVMIDDSYQFENEEKDKKEKQIKEHEIVKIAIGDERGQAIQSAKQKKQEEKQQRIQAEIQKQRQILDVQQQQKVIIQKQDIIDVEQQQINGTPQNSSDLSFRGSVENNENIDNHHHELPQKQINNEILNLQQDTLHSPQHINQHQEDFLEQTITMPHSNKDKQNNNSYQIKIIRQQEEQLVNSQKSRYSDLPDSLHKDYIAVLDRLDELQKWREQLGESEYFKKLEQVVLKYVETHIHPYAKNQLGEMLMKNGKFVINFIGLAHHKFEKKGHFLLDYLYEYFKSEVGIENDVIAFQLFMDNSKKKEQQIKANQIQGRDSVSNRQFLLQNKFSNQEFQPHVNISVIADKDTNSEQGQISDLLLDTNFQSQNFCEENQANPSHRQSDNNADKFYHEKNRYSMKQQNQQKINLKQRRDKTIKRDIQIQVESEDFKDVIDLENSTLQVEVEVEEDKDKDKDVEKQKKKAVERKSQIKSRRRMRSRKSKNTKSSVAHNRKNKNTEKTENNNSKSKNKKLSREIDSLKKTPHSRSKNINKISKNESELSEDTNNQLGSCFHFRIEVDKKDQKKRLSEVRASARLSKKKRDRLSKAKQNTSIKKAENHNKSTANTRRSKKSRSSKSKSKQKIESDIAVVDLSQQEKKQKKRVKQNEDDSDYEPQTEIGKTNSTEDDDEIVEVVAVDWVKEHLKQIDVDHAVLYKDFKAMTKNDRQIAEFLMSIQKKEQENQESNLTNSSVQSLTRNDLQEMINNVMEISEETSNHGESHPKKHDQFRRYTIEELPLTVEEVINPSILNHNIYALLRLSRLSGIQMGTRFALTRLTQNEMVSKRHVLEDFEQAKRLVGPQYADNIAYIGLNEDVLKMIQQKQKSMLIQQ